MESISVRRRLLTLFVLVAISPTAYAEKCWMVGCEDSIGYIRVKPSESGLPLPFKGSQLPKVGDVTALCQYAWLRVFAIAKPLWTDEHDSVAGNLLGPNTKVKVLEYISRSKDPANAGEFAVVRVLSDDRTCPSECSKCSGHVY
jgi:hypothetical protein